jgi:hypothetical protein
MPRHLRVRTLGPLLMPLDSLAESVEPRTVVAVDNSGRAMTLSNSNPEEIKPSILNVQEQTALRRLLQQLRRQRLFVVASTQNCHEYHRDEILTETQLANIRAAGIAVHVDEKWTW